MGLVVGSLKQLFYAQGFFTGHELKKLDEKKVRSRHKASHCPASATFRAGADPGSELSHLGLGSPRDRDLGRCVTWATPDSGTRITGGGSGYAAILPHAG